MPAPGSRISTGVVAARYDHARLTLRQQAPAANSLPAVGSDRSRCRPVPHLTRSTGIPGPWIHVRTSSAPPRRASTARPSNPEADGACPPIRMAVAGGGGCRHCHGHNRRERARPRSRPRARPDRPTPHLRRVHAGSPARSPGRCGPPSPRPLPSRPVPPAPWRSRSSYRCGRTASASPAKRCAARPPNRARAVGERRPTSS